MKKQPLAGAKYEITAAEDIYKADGVTLALKKGAVAQQLVTGKDGTAVSRKLYLGRYHVTETEAPQGYVRKDTSRKYQNSDTFLPRTGNPGICKRRAGL